jgi:hypothetical protein
MTGEEKKLITMYSQENFRGRTIRQAHPTCECGKTFDEKQLYDAPGVFFRDVEVFGKTFTLIEPTCPICKQRITASFYILN